MKGFTDLKRRPLRPAVGQGIVARTRGDTIAEVDELRIETSRSRGEKVHPLPPLAEKVLLEVRGAQEQEAAQLTDPAYRAEFVRTYDAHYEPTLMEPPLRHVKGTENLRTPGENESMRKLAEEKNKSFANRAADAMQQKVGTFVRGRDRAALPLRRGRDNDAGPVPSPRTSATSGVPSRPRWSSASARARRSCSSNRRSAMPGSGLRLRNWICSAPAAGEAAAGASRRRISRRGWRTMLQSRRTRSSGRTIDVVA
jgi:hypothetical protein